MKFPPIHEHTVEIRPRIHDPNGSVLKEVKTYCREMQLLRTNLSPGKWQDFCTGFGQTNARRELAHSGPIARAFFEKNRGYAGDPEAVDLAYGGDCIGDEMSELERRIYAWEWKLPFCQSIRARRDLASLCLAEVLAGDTPRRILAINSGHLREAALAFSNIKNQAVEFLAVDPDPLALEFLEHRYKHPALKTLRSSASGLYRKAAALGRFDFIYSLNLFDHLRNPEAERLIRLMFSLLAPGGRLLAACHLPDLSDAAYLEACLDYWPTYRTEEEMAALTRSVPQDEIAAQIVFCDDLYATVFLEVEASMRH